MEKHIVCAALSDETTPSFLWEDFKIEGEYTKDHLSGLSCVMEEVLIVSSANIFFIIGISSGANPLLMFFKSFHLENYLRISETTPESINYLVDGISRDNRFTSVHVREAFVMAKEQGSLGPGLRYLYNLFIRKKLLCIGRQDLVKQVYKIINRSFVCV